MRRALLALLLAGPACGHAEDAAPDPAVYACRAFVTGSDARNREAAMEQCVRDVLVKLSGDPALADAPAPRAAAMIEDFAYVDLMSNMKLHDEQGTRDRPFDFVGHVDPFEAAHELRRLGRTAWVAPRPALLARVHLVRAGTDIEVTADGAASERQREALLDAADRFGLRVRLAAEGARDAGGWALTPRDRQPPIDARTRLLQGALVWNETTFGWDASWTLFNAAMEPAERWTAQSDSYDAAFSAGIGGAALRLARERD